MKIEELKISALRWIVRLDQILEQQVTSLIIQAEFKKLEAVWRNLQNLVFQLATLNTTQIKLKIINLNWQDLSKDVMRAVEFDQSQLFTKVYSNEFDQAGGEPFGLIIGDYAVSHRRMLDSYDDVSVLQQIVKIAAAAFVPVIMAAAPALLGLDDFNALDRNFDLSKTFQQADYIRWRALCAEPDARFISLVLPQLLLRAPHATSLGLEQYAAEQYLWGSAVFGFAQIVARAFAESGWFTELAGRADAVGFNNEVKSYQDSFSNEAPGLALKSKTTICLTACKEQALNNLGLLVLVDTQYSAATRFYNYPSLYHAANNSALHSVNTLDQTTDLADMLHYVLCIGRFAHYLKVIARTKLGNFTTAIELEQYLQNWLHNYTTQTAELTPALKAQYPLRAANVRVHESIGSIDNYFCRFTLSPHYEFDALETQLELTTALIPLRQLIV